MNFLDLVNEQTGENWMLVLIYWYPLSKFDDLHGFKITVACPEVSV